MVDPGTHPHVLVVVQDDRLRDTLDRGLTRHGFQVSSIDRPEETAAWLAANATLEPAELILFDVQPVFAERAAATVRQLRGLRDPLPTVCLVTPSQSALFDSPGTRADLVLIKPIDLAELAMELNRLCSGGQRIASNG